jgi:hypothetical protein
VSVQYRTRIETPAVGHDKVTPAGHGSVKVESRLVSRKADSRYRAVVHPR